MPLTFEEPPPDGRGATNPRSAALAETAEELRSRPGEWALITVHATESRASSYAYMVRRGFARAFRPVGAFEAVSRTMGTEHRVYDRYVGDTPAGGEQA